jgi:hypothetical protein
MRAWRAESPPDNQFKWTDLVSLFLWQFKRNPADQIKYFRDVLEVGIPDRSTAFIADCTQVSGLATGRTGPSAAYRMVPSPLGLGRANSCLATRIRRRSHPLSGSPFGGPGLAVWRSPGAAKRGERGAILSLRARQIASLVFLCSAQHAGNLSSRPTVRVSSNAG